MTAFDTAFVTKALIARKPADHSMKEIYTVFNPASWTVFSKNVEVDIILEFSQSRKV